MSLSLAEFRQQLLDVGLVSEADLASAAGVSPGELAAALVAARRLTRYQADAALRGDAASLVLGEYVVLDLLGAGGMGQVLLAEHRRMKRRVALKILSKGTLKTPQAVQRFFREVQAAARLEHPNIVTAYDAGEARGAPFFVMQLVDGCDLHTLLERRGPLPLHEAVGYVLQTARGLEYAHSQGVVHRDVKPGNLLLDRRGVVKILDMGLARLASEGDDQLTQSGQVMGTADYMAPEQARDTHTADERSDVYSLGCTLFRLVTGRPVYERESLMSKLLAHRDDPIPSLALTLHSIVSEPSPRAPRAPGDGPSFGDSETIVDASRPEGLSLSHAPADASHAALDAVFRRMVAKQPCDRYASMAEVILALEAVHSALQPVAGARAGSALSAGSPSSGDVARGVEVPPGTSVDPPGGARAPNAAAAAAVATLASPGAAVRPHDTLSSSAALERTEATPPPMEVAVSSVLRRRSPRTPTWAIALLAALGAALLVGVVVIIRNQNGEEVARIEVPPGGTVEVIPERGPDRKPALPTMPAPPVELSAGEKLFDAKIAAIEDPERRAAAWVLAMGGLVAVENVGSSVRATPDLLRRVDRLSALTETKPEDDLEAAQIVAEIVGTLPDATTVTMVSLQSNPRATDAGLRHIAVLKNLQKIFVESSPRVRGGGWRGFRGNAALIYFVASGMPEFSDDSLIPILNASRNLVVLNVANTAIGNPSADAIASLASLKHLSVGLTRLADDGIERIVAGSPKLRMLDVKNTALTDRALESIGRHASLEILNLHSCDISDRGIARLAPLRNLLQFDCGHNVALGPRQGALVEGVTDGSLETILKWTRLERLGLAVPNLSDSGARRLTSLESLTWLDISHSQVTDEGAGELSRLPRLAGLGIMGCPRLTAAAADQLKRFPHLTSLNVVAIPGWGAAEWEKVARLETIESIDAWNSQLTDGDLLSLANAPRLKYLNVNGGQWLTQAGVKAFRAKRPDVELITSSDLPPGPAEGSAMSAGERLLDERIAAIEDPKRRGAAWVVAMGGKIAGWEGGPYVGAPPELPARVDRLAFPPADAPALADAAAEADSIVDDALRLLPDRPMNAANLAIEGNSRITDAGLRHLAGLPRAQKLLVHGPRVRGPGLVHLPAGEDLRVLSITGPELTDAVLTDLVRRAPGLVVLTSGVSPIGDSSAEAIAGLAQLEELSVGLTRITDDGFERILAGTPKLKVITISGTAATDRTFAAAARRAGLQWLSADSCDITDAGIARLNGLENLRNFRCGHLVAVGPRTDQYVAGVTDASLDTILGWKRLTDLCIACPNVTDAGVRRLAEMKELKFLDVSHTQVTDEGLGELSGLRSLTGLAVIGCEKLTDAAADQLLKFPPLKELTVAALSQWSSAAWEKVARMESVEYLAAYNTTMSDADLLGLAAMTKLKTLSISSPNLTPEGLKAFRAKRPDVTLVGP